MFGSRNQAEDIQTSLMSCSPLIIHIPSKHVSYKNTISQASIHQDSTFPDPVFYYCRPDVALKLLVVLMPAMSHFQRPDPRHMPGWANRSMNAMLVSDWYLFSCSRLPEECQYKITVDASGLAAPQSVNHRNSRHEVLCRHCYCRVGRQCLGL